MGKKRKKSVIWEQLRSFLVPQFANIVLFGVLLLIYSDATTILGLGRSFEARSYSCEEQISLSELQKHHRTQLQNAVEDSEKSIVAKEELPVWLKVFLAILPMLLIFATLVRKYTEVKINLDNNTSEIKQLRQATKMDSEVVRGDISSIREKMANLSGVATTQLTHLHEENQQTKATLKELQEGFNELNKAINMIKIKVDHLCSRTFTDSRH